MRQKLTFIILAISTIILLTYLFWWHYNGVYSGYYYHIYGLIITDKLAFLALFLLGVIVIISLIKLIRDWRYGLLILGVALFVLTWTHVLETGRKVLRLDGCFESVCSEIVLKDNGRFYLSTKTQTISYSYSGAFQIENSVVCLYKNPKFEAINQAEELARLARIKCLKAVAKDFNLWGGCFKVTVL